MLQLDSALCSWYDTLVIHFLTIILISPQIIVLSHPLNLKSLTWNTLP